MASVSLQFARNVTLGPDSVTLVMQASYRKVRIWGKGANHHTTDFALSSNSSEGSGLSLESLKD